MAKRAEENTEHNKNREQCAQRRKETKTKVATKKCELQLRLPFSATVSDSVSNSLAMPDCGGSAAI